MDFAKQMNAFKAVIQNMNDVNVSNLKFNWTITDASGTMIPLS